MDSGDERQKRLLHFFYWWFILYRRTYRLVVYSQFAHDCLGGTLYGGRHLAPKCGDEANPSRVGGSLHHVGDEHVGPLDASGAQELLQVKIFLLDQEAGRVGKAAE